MCTDENIGNVPYLHTLFLYAYLQNFMHYSSIHHLLRRI